MSGVLDRKYLTVEHNRSLRTPISQWLGRYILDTGTWELEVVVVTVLLLLVLCCLRNYSEANIDIDFVVEWSRECIVLCIDCHGGESSTECSSTLWLNHQYSGWADNHRHCCWWFFKVSPNLGFAREFLRGTLVREG